MFCLYYNASTKKIHALNGSGRYAANVSLDKIRQDLGLSPDDVGAIPLESALAATVPGAAAGWIDTIEKFGSGKLSVEQILAPAIELAEKGFPVSEFASYFVSRLGIKTRQMRELISDLVAQRRKAPSRRISKFQGNAQT